jgi:hypothetical protein
MIDRAALQLLMMKWTQLRLELQLLLLQQLTALLLLLLLLLMGCYS